VPFDDQSMPQLHAKIKKGVVEYPPGLTTGMHFPIRASRELVTDLSQNADTSSLVCLSPTPSSALAWPKL
jgi:hypothetical protein